MSSGFTIIGYADADDLPAVYIEHAAGGAWVENEDDVTRFEAMFTEVTELALGSAETTALIKSQVRAVEKS